MPPVVLQANVYVCANRAGHRAASSSAEKNAPFLGATLSVLGSNGRAPATRTLADAEIGFFPQVPAVNVWTALVLTLPSESVTSTCSL